MDLNHLIQLFFFYTDFIFVGSIVGLIESLVGLNYLCLTNEYFIIRFIGFL